MTLKVCRQCNAAKPIEEFHKNSHTRDRRQADCKPCANARAKAWRAAHPTQDADRQETPERRAYRLVTDARKRAQEKGRKFDLTPEWVYTRVSAGKCEATGIPFVFERGTSAGGAKAFSPSIDRIDNSLGYTMDNCQVVCWMYNAAKGTATQADVLRMARSLVAANQ